MSFKNYVEEEGLCGEGEKMYPFVKQEFVCNNTK
jgi:hypothetical protein